MPAPSAGPAIGPAAAAPRHRRAVISGRLQRPHPLARVIAGTAEDISPMRDLLLAEQGRQGDPAFADGCELS
ncbi:hypothetical protein [Leisingera daeponensis]|uniref:hypothetical protein n=1 Tax=Leisingera daeponensis TaxID=405746 RepID=UPI0004156B0D|nr:hypothetical protein [Leisingera daeponensis]